jgi:transposase-like protein
MRLGRPTRTDGADIACPSCGSRSVTRRGEARETFDNGQTVVKREHFTCDDCDGSWWVDVWPDERVYVAG